MNGHHSNSHYRCHHHHRLTHHLPYAPPLLLSPQPPAPTIIVIFHVNNDDKWGPSLDFAEHGTLFDLEIKDQDMSLKCNIPAAFQKIYWIVINNSS